MIKLKDFTSIKSIFTCLIVASIFAASCSSDEDDPIVIGPEPEEMDVCADVEAEFARDVKPLIDASCALSGCHVSGGGAPGDFASYDGVKNSASGIISRAVIAGNMPPASSSAPKLNDSQKLLIQCWVEAGAMNN